MTYIDCHNKRSYMKLVISGQLPQYANIITIHDQN